MLAATTRTDWTTFVGSTATSGNTMRIMPWAVADVLVGSVGTASTAQFMTYDATNGVRPLNATAEMSVPAASAAVVASSNTRVVNAGVNSGAAATAITTNTINSLTFETGGGLVINNFRDLRIDSGGILAKSSNTLSVAGTGLGVGAINARDAGTNARTFFVHVMGSGNTLTSNATFGGVVAPTSGGLAKTGDGKLLLNSASGSNYTGTTTISLGTLELASAAPNNALFYRFATSAMNATTTGDNDDALVVTAGGTLSVTAGTNESHAPSRGSYANSTATPRCSATFWRAPAPWAAAGSSTTAGRSRPSPRPSTQPAIGRDRSTEASTSSRAAAPSSRSETIISSPGMRPSWEVSSLWSTKGVSPAWEPAT